MLTPESLISRWGGAESAPDEAGAAALIAAATEWMQSQTGRYFGEPKEVDEVVSGDNDATLWLREEPYVDESLAGPLEVFEAAGIGADMVALDEEGFVTRGRKLVRTGYRRWWSSREYRLVYWVGYPLDAGPADVREAVAQLAMWMWGEMATGVAGGVREEKLGDYAYKIGGTGAQRIFEDVPMLASVVAAWRRIPV